MQAETQSSYGNKALAGSQVDNMRQAEVPHQIDMLQRNARGLSEVVGHIEARLGGIVRPEPPANVPDKTQPRSVPATGVGSQMQDINDELVAVRVRAESLLARLEV
jgi:hypothetical protein